MDGSARQVARAWREPLLALARRLREGTRGALHAALAEDRLEALGRPVARGAGDTTFGLDVAPEALLETWFEERAREGPLSLFTEDAGWRHSGGSAGDPFDHGGPRIVVDPVDGARNLMHDLRPAWTVVSFCGPGRGMPRYGDLVAGLVSEIPDSRSTRARRLWAVRGEGCSLALEDLSATTAASERPLRTDSEARVDHGYFSFFAYHPVQRPPVAALGTAFFQRLEAFEGADLDHCYDDQYISSGGQLALLALGTYRLVVDVRGSLAVAAPQAKPYDMAGAALCAEEAGCVVRHPRGGPLDFPLDATTPVDFAGFANAATERRLGPHLSAVLETGA